MLNRIKVLSPSRSSVSKTRMIGGGGERVSGILVSPRKAKARRWFVYILKCHDGTLYTGITNDLARREAEHNSGTASRYTRSRRPVQIIYQKPCANRSAALKKEYAVKSLTRKEKEDYIERHAEKLRVLQM